MTAKLAALTPAVITAMVIGALFYAMADDKVRIHVIGSQFPYEPADIRLQIRIEPDHANRALAVELTSEGYSTSSVKELDGADAAIWRELTYSAVPAGEYDVTAVVYRPDASHWRSTARVTVIGRH